MRAGGEGGLEGGGSARDGVEVACSQHELAHLRFRAAQDGARVVDVDIAVAPAQASDTGHDGAHLQRAPIHRPVAIGRDQHNAVADLHVQPAREQFGHQDLATLKQALAVAAQEAVGQGRGHAHLARGVDTVDADVGGFAEVGKQRTELHARRDGENFGNGSRDPLPGSRLTGRHVEMQRECLDRSHVAAGGAPAGGPA